MQTKGTHKHKIDACVFKSSGPRCEIGKNQPSVDSSLVLVHTRVLRRICACTTLLCGTCKKMATVITVRVPTCRGSLLCVIVFAQADSTCDQRILITHSSILQRGRAVARLRCARMTTWCPGVTTLNSPCDNSSKNRMPKFLNHATMKKTVSTCVHLTTHATRT